jgi:hypothetical protein
MQSAVVSEGLCGAAQVIRDRLTIMGMEPVDNMQFLATLCFLLRLLFPSGLLL